MNHAHLIDAAITGQADSVEELLIHYQPTISRFARKYCATPEDVEDAVQETLWIASQKIGTLRVSSALVSWLFKVVRNYCYRLLRIKRREEPLEGSARLAEAEDDGELQIALRRDIAEAVARLPSTYRQVLIMRDIEDMTAPQVAAALGITVETVKARLHRARASLREALAGWRGPSVP
jgi:RNA polymerase sigma factor (sigma-70 family)